MHVFATVGRCSENQGLCDILWPSLKNSATIIHLLATKPLSPRESCDGNPCPRIYSEWKAGGG